VTTGPLSPDLPPEPSPDDEELVVPDDDELVPEGEGPAASEEDFEPEDIDPEAVVDEE
jgi:hypothetical protein